MNTSAGGGKKSAAVCRYFLTTGSCFYGFDCQFVHASPSPTTAALLAEDATAALDSPASTMAAPLALREPLENIGGQSSRLDIYLPFSHQNGVQPESKLSTYTNRPITPSSNCSSVSESPAAYALSSTPSRSSVDQSGGRFSLPSPSGGGPNAAVNHLTTNLSALGLDSMPNPAANEFVPRLSTPVVNHTQMSHNSVSSPFMGFESISPLDSIPYSTCLAQVGGANSSGSPLSSPQLTPRHSPLLKRRSHSPMPLTNFIPASMPAFQNVDGTTYFYSAENNSLPANDTSRVVVPNYVMFPFTPSHISHMKPKANAPSFFMPDELRLEILQRHSMQLTNVDPEQHPELPAEVDNYHNLYPLETSSSSGSGSHADKSGVFGYATTVHRATNIKNGFHYCLRRIQGFRQVYHKAITLVDMWKKLQHSNICQLCEVFTTKAFGDHCVVFVHDYHPGAETLMAKHFKRTHHQNGTVPALYRGSSEPSGGSRNFVPQGAGPSLAAVAAGSVNSAGEPRQHAGLLAESLIWAYVVQLCSAIRTIHAAGLACRTLDPTKILITGKSRIRLNCCGIYDVLSFDPNQANPMALIPHYQQEDLTALGNVVLQLACNSLEGVQRENIQSSMELVARNYSSDLRNLILYLLTNQNRVRSVNDIMPMIGARFFTQLDAAHLRSDVIENELAKEVECGRLFRLVTKLGIINERPEFNLDTEWSETGDRYLLKLFRDYLFHQVTDEGRPWIDMAHVVHNLNKLDAGTSEKVCLMSRDEQNVLVVSYAELKHCFETSFNEIAQASHDPQRSATT